VFNSFLGLIKNKIFLILLLIINTVVFILGFVIEDINLMVLSVVSYATVLLSLELNKKPPDTTDD
jgi:hypothetical protein|tara:strand:- start:2465 stop:2659 length:195 start_codon:yes stop_codon:yes gene_type:complete